MHRIHWIIFVLLMVLAAPAIAAEPQSKGWKDLQEMMSAEEFRAAGLDKLNKEELSRLNQWLINFVAHDSEQVVKSDENIKALQKIPVRRRIAGPFRGWSGETVFTLDNGEIWKQRLPSRYAISLESPEVELFKNLFGFYEMRVVQTGRKVGVTRIK